MARRHRTFAVAALVLALAWSAVPLAAAPTSAGVRAASPAAERHDPGTSPWERVPRDRVAEECGLDPDLLEAADEELAPLAYTVVRYGKLCWEARHTDEIYHVASITKTLGGLMVGVAATRSSLSDEDRIDQWADPLLWPGVNNTATVAHALSMTAFNPVLAYPVKTWMYDILGNREIDILMDAVDAVIEQEPRGFPGVSDRVELVQQEIFDKLGMADSSWAGETIGFSMDSTPRDLARMGLLMARGGFYNGEQLIDPEYMYRMTHPTFEDANTGYGYLTQMNADLGWIYSTGTNDPECSPVARWPHYPHRPFYEASNDHGGGATRGDMPYDVGVYWASGAGGQRIVVHRALDLVMTIRDESTNEGHKSTWNAVRPALVAEDPVYQGDEDAFCADYRNNAYAPDLLPDLTVATPTLAVTEDGVRFQAVVSNPGEQHATDVPIRFLVDGQQVGGDVSLEEVPFGDSVVANSAPWQPPAGTQTHRVRVQVDPDGVVPHVGSGPQEASLSFSLAGGRTSVSRFAGPDRIATAAAVSGAGQEGADTVVIARADDPADALAGAPLAAHLDAPLLLSAGNRLSAATAREVRRLGATEAVLLGGEAALSEQVAKDLASLPVEVAVVRRVDGENRWETAAAIAGELPDADEVFVVRGDAGGFADAITVSGLAASLAQPILLTGRTQLPEATAEALDDGTDVVVVGGSAAVSAGVEGELAELAATVRRLQGSTRYGTSAAVAGEALDRNADPGLMWIATGTGFPDGLVAGAATARDGGLLLLVDGRDLDRSPQSRDFLRANPPTLLRLAGGTAAISTRAQSQLEALLR